MGKKDIQFEDILLTGGLVLTGYLAYTTFIKRGEMKPAGLVGETPSEEPVESPTLAPPPSPSPTPPPSPPPPESPTLVLPPWYNIVFMRDDPGPGTWYEPPEDPEKELTAENLCGPENEEKRMQYYRMAYREILNYVFGRGKRHFVSACNLLVTVWWCPPTSEREIQVRDDLARLVVGFGEGIDRAKSIAATVRNGVALITAIITYAKRRGLM